MGSPTEATLASATAIDLFRNGDLPNHGSDGKLWLQYWMFYYYNALNVETIGLHEGDFEMIQVALDAAGQPSEAVYAQHNGGERCPWSGVEHAGGIPVVYVRNIHTPRTTRRTVCTTSSIALTDKEVGCSRPILKASRATRRDGLHGRDNGAPMVR